MVGTVTHERGKERAIIEVIGASRKETDLRDQSQSDDKSAAQKSA